MQQQSNNPSCPQNDDEIDLRELWQKLFEGKWIIVTVTLLTTLCAVAYTQLVTPTYKTSVYLLPPLFQDIQELNQKEFNQKEFNQKEYSPDGVFARFLTNVQSRNLRQRFFEQKQLLSLYTDDKVNFDAFEVFEKKFNQKLIVEKVSKTDPKPYTELVFELKNDNPELSARHLNAFVAFITHQTVQELSAEVQSEISNQKKLINEQIDSKKELAEKKRSDRIKMLEESLVIAKKLGIEQAQITQSDNKLNMDYNRGSRALEAELRVLKTRESDEPFIGGIRDLQERISYLSNLAIRSDKISVVRIDQEAQVPFEPIKPVMV